MQSFCAAMRETITSAYHPKKFYIFFKILPFPITERATKRFLDIKLTDYRLRSWRLLYIEHLRSQKAMVDLQSVRIGPSSPASSKLPGGSQANSDKEGSAERASLLQDSPANANAAPKKRRKQTSTSISSDSTVSLSAMPSSPTIALKLPQIMWPTISEETKSHLPALFEWHVAAHNNIYVCCDRVSSIGQLVDIVRQALAIPTNFQELIHLVPDAGSSSPTEEQKQSLVQQREQLMQHQDDIRSCLTDACCGKGAVVSDQLKVLYHKANTAQDALASTTMAYGDDGDSETVSGELDEGQSQLVMESEDMRSITSMLEVLPDYPLAIMSVRGNIIDEIFAATSKVDQLVNTWPDCNCPFNNLFTVALQHVGVEDMLFMLGKHPLVNSCIVSVYNFTLLGNSVNVCSVDDFTGPFISYIRQDDTYHSIWQRFGAITGDSEKDWDRCRLAVVRNKTPYFVTRPAKVEESAAAQQKQSSTMNQKSVWSLLMEHNPDFARLNCDTKAINDNQRHTRIYPHIGIQRPVSDIAQFSKINRRLGTGIKIV
mmetsp:Transcript_6726/g.9306  ORF Transcript_6726/g.9306 Transcript_6726/m.9306 type:complete len:543 (-) Transcript_6726:119-1747(-)